MNKYYINGVQVTGLAELGYYIQVTDLAIIEMVTTSVFAFDGETEYNNGALNAHWHDGVYCVFGELDVLRDIELTLMADERGEEHLPVETASQRSRCCYRRELRRAMRK